MIGGPDGDFHFIHQPTWNFIKLAAPDTSQTSNMPPRVPVRLAHSLQQPKFTLFSFLVPFLQHPQTRNASILSSLSDNPSAYNKKIRRGRGPSSGKGKTSGRGQKGQKARGKVPKNFNGGQTPESMAHGKMGFKNVYVQSYVGVMNMADSSQASC